VKEADKLSLGKQQATRLLYEESESRRFFTGNAGAVGSVDKGKSSVRLLRLRRCIKTLQVTFQGKWQESLKSGLGRALEGILLAGE